MPNPPTLRAVVFGSTGVAGSEVLRQCISDGAFSSVCSIARRPTGVTADKHREVMCEDFLDLTSIAESVGDVDVCFYCLGVSAQQVKDPGAYRKITYDYTMAAARAFRAASPQHTFHFLSGQGADPSGKSRMMWARVKGDAERDLPSIGLNGLVIWRPGYIHPMRPRDQPLLSDWVMRPLYPLVRLLVPWVVVGSDDLGAAMLAAARTGVTSGLMTNSQIRRLARRDRRET